MTLLTGVKKLAKSWVSAISEPKAFDINKLANALRDQAQKDVNKLGKSEYTVGTINRGIDKKTGAQKYSVVIDEEPIFDIAHNPNNPEMMSYKFSIVSRWNPSSIGGMNEKDVAKELRGPVKDIVEYTFDLEEQEEKSSIKAAVSEQAEGFDFNELCTSLAKQAKTDIDRVFAAENYKIDIREDPTKDDILRSTLVVNGEDSLYIKFNPAEPNFLAYKEVGRKNDKWRITSPDSTGQMAGQLRRYVNDGMVKAITSWAGQKQPERGAPHCS